MKSKSRLLWIVVVLLLYYPVKSERYGYFADQASQTKSMGHFVVYATIGTGVYCLLSEKSRSQRADSRRLCSAMVLGAI